jgi:hypothetical protein
MKDEETAAVCFTMNSKLGTISCDIPVKENQAVLLAQAGEKFRLLGSISKVEQYHATISGAKVEPPFA